MWILGSSDYGAQVAAHFGLPYAFAWFFTDGRGGREAIEIYRKTYRPSAQWPEPHAAICVWALAAETEAEALRQYQSRARTRLLRDRGVFAALEPADVAGAYDYSDAERAKMVAMRQSAFVGTAAQVAEGIDKLVRDLGISEVAVVTWAYDEDVRIESYRLLGKAMGLAPQVASTAG
jgi:luciferase family oxidoreductase group 1